MRIQDRREPRGSYGAVPIGRIAPNVMRHPRGSEGGGITRRRTFQPVRRNSYDVHDARAKVFRPIAGGEVASALRWRDKLVQTAQEYDDHHKEHGSRLGPIGDTGIRVLHTLLTRCCDFKTGRCEPSIETLMRYTRYARATVVHALARLRKHGFLDWVRRTRKTERARRRPAGGTGDQRLLLRAHTASRARVQALQATPRRQSRRASRAPAPEG